jgi:hypothetical protein
MPAVRLNRKLDAVPVEITAQSAIEFVKMLDRGLAGRPAHRHTLRRALRIGDSQEMGDVRALFRDRGVREIHEIGRLPVELMFLLGWKHHQII